MNGLLSSCNICPRKCGINRLASAGTCGADWRIKINRWQLHNWEEPVISGKNGSGTIFFSGCNLNCVFCQNHIISQGLAGTYYTPDDLARIMLELQDMNAHNINLVTPTHFTIQAIEALEKAIHKGLSIPVVWNSSGYEEPETLRMLNGLVDVYMPDFKYFDPLMSAKYSGAGDYPEKAKNSIIEMFSQAGHIILKNGVAVSGVMIRLLVLPENINSIELILKWIYENLGNETWISLMGQYYPAHRSREFPEISRCITAQEYDFTLSLMDKYGFENGFIQESGSTSEYTPDFSEDIC